jgi:hypothetical protein
MIRAEFGAEKVTCALGENSAAYPRLRLVRMCCNVVRSGAPLETDLRLSPGIVIDIPRH